jgi:hypothetical protein
MKYLSVLAAVLFLFTACGNNDRAESAAETDNDQNAHEQFFANLSSLCGETFTGESSYPDDPEHDLVDTELRAHISSCGDEKIEVDLYRDTDTWHATWVVEKREGGLHLYHEHIGDKEYEEGEEPLTGYGGYADDRGSEYQQYFPADDHTAEILPEASTNVWMMEMDLDDGTFVYYLERHDQPRFRAQLSLDTN